LSNLNLEGNKVGDLAISWISLRLKGLEYVNFINNKVGNIGASKISANCKNLKELHMSWNNITEDGALKLASMKQLKTLDIKTNFVGISGAIAIARGLSEMEFLRIGNNKIGDYGVEMICNNLKKINRLGLWDSFLTSNSAEQIAKLTNLTWLTVANNNLRELDIIEMCHSLKALKHFDVSKIDISENGRNMMKGILPDCDILFSNVV